MPLGPQQVNNPTIADGTDIPGLTEETVNIAGGLISSITDLDLNVFIGDDRDIFFGTDVDFSIGISTQQDSLQFRDHLLNKTLLELRSDDSITFATADRADMHNWGGNFALTDSGAYIRRG